MKRWRRDEDGNPIEVDLPLHVVIDASRRILTHGLDLPEPGAGLERVTVDDTAWSAFEMVGAHHLAEDGTVVVTPPTPEEQTAIDRGLRHDELLHLLVRNEDSVIIGHGERIPNPGDPAYRVALVGRAELAKFERPGDKVLAEDGTVTVLEPNEEQRAILDAQEARATRRERDGELLRQAAAEDPRFAALAHHLGIA